MSEEPRRTNILKTPAQVALEKAKEKRRQEDEAFAKFCKICLSALKASVGDEWFPIKPFLQPEGREEEVFGGNWQANVCRELEFGEMPKNRMEEFWNKKKGGKDCARDSLTRKRMNVTNMMKTKFQGRSQGRGVLGPSAVGGIRLLLGCCGLFEMCDTADLLLLVLTGLIILCLFLPDRCHGSGAVATASCLEKGGQ